MSEWIKVAAKSEIGTGSGKIVEVGDRQVALFQVDGNYCAIDNICPHRGGPLGEGDVEGTVVTCPWHGWQFDVCTGESPVNPAAKVQKFNIKAEGDDLLLETP